MVLVALGLSSTILSRNCESRALSAHTVSKSQMHQVPHPPRADYSFLNSGITATMFYLVQDQIFKEYCSTQVHISKPQ